LTRKGWKVLPPKPCKEVLSCALNGKADLFITGDKELLGLIRIGDMEIVSPRTFWEKLKTQ
jgi:predicted nucleic acid-binding protein